MDWRITCGFSNVIDVGAIGSKGGLFLGWKDNSLTTLRSFSNYHIDAYIQDNEIVETWYPFVFYENPEDWSRRLSWEILR